MCAVQPVWMPARFALTAWRTCRAAAVCRSPPSSLLFSFVVVLVVIGRAKGLPLAFIPTVLLCHLQLYQAEGLEIFVLLPCQEIDDCR